jgi:septal ring factor EnvC (AmiA/AmiB activator)
MNRTWTDEQEQYLVAHYATTSNAELAAALGKKNARNTQDNERIDALKKDLDRKHRECAERERQCMMLAEDNERLQDELKHIKAIIAGFLNGGAVGERGKACMSIDGSNL